jgi:hypothetical protein
VATNNKLTIPTGGPPSSQLRAARLRFAATDARGPDRAPIRVPPWNLKPVTRPRDLDYPASRPKHGGKKTDEESPFEQLDDPVKR